MEDERLIPAEIVFEILLRIPCRPLLEKFRYICKLWYAIIKDPQFIYLHLDRSRKSSTQLAIVTRSFEVSNATMTLHLSSLTNQVEGWTSKQLLSKTGLNPFYVITSLSVNGLICIHERNKDIHVCNPSTGEFITLPKRNLLPSDYDETLGFGFDSSTKEYKVVRACFPFRYDFERDVGTERCEIFTLGSKIWRRINAPTGPLSSYTVSIDGIIYWVVNRKFKELEIICFDVRNEEHGKVPPPKGERGSGAPVLLELKGRLYLVETSGQYWVEDNGDLIRNNYSSEEKVEIWMLEDCRNKNHVWIKVYNLVLDSNVLQRSPRQWLKVIPVHISDRMILFEGFDGGVVGCYDTERGSFTKIYEKSNCRAVCYIESLVPLRPL